MDELNLESIDFEKYKKLWKEDIKNCPNCGYIDYGLYSQLSDEVVSFGMHIEKEVIKNAISLLEEQIKKNEALRESANTSLKMVMSKLQQGFILKSDIK